MLQNQHISLCIDMAEKHWKAIFDLQLFLFTQVEFKQDSKTVTQADLSIKLNAKPNEQIYCDFLQNDK